MAIEDILAKAVATGATDIHMVAKQPITFRIAGGLEPMDDTVLQPESCNQLCLSLLSDLERGMFEVEHDIDVIRTFGKNRFRINLSYSNNQIGAVIRVLNFEPLPLDALHLPPVIKSICQRDKGIFLVTGTTSQGKTTTLSAMVDYINRHRNHHIVTIEDPIEYVHKNKRSIVRQREIGKDTKSFETGLKAALRQDPDVIVIGEMRDYDSIKIALTAAETGMLVLSTLHTRSIDKIIERLFSYVPSDQEGQIRMMLSESLLGAIHQELLPTVSGGKRVACEVLIATQAIRHTIRRPESFFLKSYIQTGEKVHGMRTMRRSLEELLEADEITQQVFDETLRNYS